MSIAHAVRAVVTRRIGAQAEDVFDAWLDPAKVRQWFGPGLGEVSRAEIDARVGGTFWIVQRRAAGEAVHTGEYEELERPRRLVFSWRTPPATDASRVIIEIGSTAEGCEVTLTHEMEPQGESFKERAAQAWGRMVDALGRTVVYGPDTSAQYRTVMPYLVVADADAEIDFLKAAFGAAEIAVNRLPDGSVMHAELQVGDSVVMLGQAGEQWQPRTASLYLWGQDVDATHARAVAAGGTSRSAPADKPYGHRIAEIDDVNGITWWVGSPVKV
jgi:PhnB protein